MLHYPDAMKKAQAELDRVVGSDRMPEYGDKESLPYTNALIKETMRTALHVTLHVAAGDRSRRSEPHLTQ
ncbi:hypothetical protein C0995_013044 [Termitomyces sp. Mi166|nr:hypothetical protein C0995_013044 [Termitomyces sp. Mi166\